MGNRISVAAFQFLVFAGVGLCFLSGCGDGGYVSEEQFLESVRQEPAHTGETGEGTLPPVGESMDNVARIRVETNEFDVGVIANDKLHFDKLKVFNDGKMPLKLTRVDTTCACTQGSIPPERAVVPAGGETWIDVVIDPYRIPGFHSHKVLTIVSTDPEQGAVQVGVTAEVAPEFEVEQDTIDVGDIAKGETLERRVRFRQVQDAPITLGGIEPATKGANGPLVPGVSGVVEPIPEADWQEPGHPEYDLVITIGPELPAGTLQRNLLLNLDTPRMKQFWLAITGTVIAPYTVTPNYPTRAVIKAAPKVGAPTGHAAFAAKLPITLSDFVTDVPGLVIATQAGISPNEMGLVFTLPDGLPPVAIDTVVRLKVHVDGRSFDELVAVRSAPAAGAPQLPEGHSAHDGHDH